MKRTLALIAVTMAAAFIAGTAQGAGGSFHNPANVGSHIQQALSRQAVLLDLTTATKIKCVATRRLIVCQVDARAEGMWTHNTWRYTYVSPKLAKVVHRVEWLNGDLLVKDTDYVAPQRYGLSSF